MDRRQVKELVKREKSELESRKRNIDRIVQRVKNLVKEKYSDIRIALVGSAARGDIHLKSDIDFLLLSQVSAKTFFTILRDLEDICYQYNIPCHLIDYEEIENKRAMGVLRKEMIVL